MNRKRISTFLTGFLCCLLALSAGMQAVGSQTAPEAAKAGGLQTIQVSENVKLEVEGEPFIPRSSSGKELPVFLYQGAAYAPVRALSERMGYRVYYSEKSRTAQMDPSVTSEKKEQQFLHNNLEKRMALVKSIEFRDQEGRKAVVDSAEGSGEDSAFLSWYKRLWFHNQYDKVFTENNERPEDYQGSGIDVVFRDEAGDCIAKFQDVSEQYMTYVGEYYKTRFGYLDIERIRRVLEGKPDEFEPEKLFDIGQADWIILNGGDIGKTVKIDDPETITKLTDLFNAVECRREDTYYGWSGCGLTFTWYRNPGEIVESIGVSTANTLKYDKFFRSITSAPLDTAWFRQLIDELPAADWADKNPILTLSGALDAQYVWIENGTNTLAVDVSDPELVKRLAENIGNIRFQVGEHVTGSSWDKADDGRCFVQWLVDEEDYKTYAEITACVLDEKTIAFYGSDGYYATAMDGKTIDKQLLDDLLDPNGPYADNPQVNYQKLSEE